MQPGVKINVTLHTETSTVIYESRSHPHHGTGGHQTDLQPAACAENTPLGKTPAEPHRNRNMASHARKVEHPPCSDTIPRARHCPHRRRWPRDNQIRSVSRRPSLLNQRHAPPLLLRKMQQSILFRGYLHPRHTNPGRIPDQNRQLHA